MKRFRVGADRSEASAYLQFSNKMCNLISMKPGVHWMQPFVTEVVSIRITPETMTMAPMICTTQDGVRNVFRDVQV